MAIVQLDFIAETDGPRWPERLDAGARVLESHFAGDPLVTATAWKEGEPDQTIEDRVAYFAGRMRTERRWFALHGAQVRPAFPGATHPGDHALLGFTGGVLKGSPACMAVGAFFVAHDPAQVARILVEIGDALVACSARWTPPLLDAWQRVLQTGRRDTQQLAARTPPGVTLPRLRMVATRQPLQPECGGWWNYWSAQTCAFLGVPDPATDPDLRDLAQPTPGGAWLVRLQPDAPDDLTPDAMQRIAWLHQRLPKLGLRG